MPAVKEVQVLKIEAAQWIGLEAAAKKDALPRLVDYVNRRFPSVFADAAQDRLETWMEAQVSMANAHGFENDEHVALYLDLVVMYGHNFAREPWAAPILDDIAATPQIKADLLRQQALATGVEI